MPNKEYRTRGISQQHISDESISRYIELESERIRHASGLKDHVFRETCLFSIIESMAQGYTDFMNNPADTFVEFVDRFDNDHRDLLHKIDPVTLFYRIENYLESQTRIQIEGLLRRNIGTGNSNLDRVLNSSVTNLICEELSSRCEQSCIDALKREHRYINLLYRLRCKLSHENQVLGGTNQFSNPDTKEPFYIYHPSIDKDTNGVFDQEYFALIIPAAFIEDIAHTCLINYFKFYGKQNKDPYFQYTNNRLCTFSWYDKIPKLVLKAYSQGDSVE